ncbi:MAG: hypothetical protein M3O22_08815 [Pseudomonadota bacterium]|nr:hypothetical protein [Pseudomonadota bacterium]
MTRPNVGIGIISDGEYTHCRGKLPALSEEQERKLAEYAARDVHPTAQITTGKDGTQTLVLEWGKKRTGPEIGTVSIEGPAGFYECRLYGPDKGLGARCADALKSAAESVRRARDAVVDFVDPAEAGVRHESRRRMNLFGPSA